jgi:HEAT repeat protein
LNYSALFDYLSQFQDATLPFLAELFEPTEDQTFRQKAKDLFQNKIQSDPGIIVTLVDDQRPLLSEAIIEMMQQQQQQSARKIIPRFSHFLTLSTRELKIKAIEALGSFNDEMANKILLGFFNDPEEEIRIKATLSLKFLSDPTRLKQLMREIYTKKFRLKRFQEKKALFEFLGRTRSQEAFTFLKKVFLKKSLFPSTAELRICAVAGLEAMATEEALELLRRGEIFFNKKVRKAVAHALVSLASRKTRG